MMITSIWFRQDAESRYSPPFSSQPRAAIPFLIWRDIIISFIGMIAEIHVDERYRASPAHYYRGFALRAPITFEHILERCISV